MVMFQNRIQAGEELGGQLKQYHACSNGIVIGLPRGGVPVAYEVAQGLELPLDIVCPRKIGAPNNKEFAIGAITETGEGMLNHDVITRFSISEDYIKNEVETQKQRALEELSLFRQDRPQRMLKGKVVIIVDDGLATGSTMKAAVQSVRLEGAEKIVVAVPVSPPDTLKEIEELVDEVVCLDAPPYFQAVGQFYEDFSQTTDEEVITFLKIAK